MIDLVFQIYEGAFLPVIFYVDPVHIVILLNKGGPNVNPAKKTNTTPTAKYQNMASLNRSAIQIANPWYNKINMIKKINAGDLATIVNFL